MDFLKNHAILDNFSSHLTILAVFEHLYILEHFCQFLPFVTFFLLTIFDHFTIFDNFICFSKGTKTCLTDWGGVKKRDKAAVAARAILFKILDFLFDPQ